MPIRLPAVTRLRPGNAHQPADRRHDDAEHALQRDRRAADVGQQAEHGVDEMHQRHQHDQHGDDVEQQLRARRRCP